MDNITYQVILEYLSSNTLSNDTDFPNKHNLMINMTESEHFSKYFNKNYYRHGVLIFDTVQNNISFFSSFLSLVDNNFMSLDKFKQNKIIYLLKDYLLNQFTENNLYKTYKLNLTEIPKNIIKDEIKNKVTPIVIQLVIEIFKINFIIFNYDNNDKYIFFPGSCFDIYKPTIFIAQKNEYFEPIIKNKQKMFNVNDKIIKILLSKKFKYVKFGSVKKKILINRNLHQSVDLLLDDTDEIFLTQEEDENISESASDDKLLSDSITMSETQEIQEIQEIQETKPDKTLDIYIKKEEQVVLPKKEIKYNLKKLLRMKKSELIKLALSLNIKDNDMSKKTKKLISTEIINSY